MKYKTEIINIDAAATIGSAVKAVGRGESPLDPQDEYKMLMFTNYASKIDDIFFPFVSKDGNNWGAALAAWQDGERLNLTEMCIFLKEKYKEAAAGE